MTDADTPTHINDSIEAGQYDAARALLGKLPAGLPIADVLRIKLAVRERKLEPGTAMQRLVSLMRSAPSTPGLQALYQEVSKIAYETSASTMAHSHPPPPPGKFNT